MSKWWNSIYLNPNVIITKPFVDPAIVWLQCFWNKYPITNKLDRNTCEVACYIPFLTSSLSPIFRPSLPWFNGTWFLQWGMEVHSISSWNFTIRGKTIPHPKSSQYTWKQAEKPKTKYNQHPTQRIYFQNRWKVDASTKIIAKHSNWLFRLGKAAFLGAMKVDEPSESKGEFSLPSHGFIPLRSGTPQYLAPEVASTLARYDEHLGYERFFGPKNSVGEWRRFGSWNSLFGFVHVQNTGILFSRDDFSPKSELEG